MKHFIIFLLKPLSFLPALAIMYMIFTFSAQEGAVSSNLSYKVSHQIVTIGNQILDRNLSDGQINDYAERIHGPVRKLAHMSEYFILAVAVAFPLYVYRLRGFLLLLLAGSLCIGFAFLDEYHQSFVGGRSSSLRDVAIDDIGIFLGIMVVRIVCWSFLPHYKKHKKRNYV